MDEIQALRQEVAELRQKIAEVEAWSNGVFDVAQKVLPYLLQDHPATAKVREQLKIRLERYEELSEFPEHARPDELQTEYEAAKLFYHRCGWMGLWPDPEGEELLQGLRRKLKT